MKIICVIDDDAVYQKMLNQHLTSMGYTVQSFFSGRDLERLPKKPTAILLDHFLGDGELGVDILDHLRKKMPQVPVIYMTNESSELVKQQARDAGAFDFIEKNPASLVLLRNALDRIDENKTKRNWLKRILRKD